jgi:hypothetical protein
VAARKPNPPPVGLRPLREFESAWAVARADRAQALREAAAQFRPRFLGTGVVSAVRTVPLVSIPVPTRLVLGGAAVLGSRATLTGRMAIVQFEDFSGALRTLVWEPIRADALAQALMFARPASRRAVGVGQFLAPVELRSIARVLERARLDPSEVDFVAFGDLRGHDLRRLIGTSRPLESEHQARAPLFEHARFLVQRDELATVAAPHPIQAPWYVPNSTADILRDRIVALTGDVQLGPGVALIATPGLSSGHQTLVLATVDGIWVLSSNAVASDCWQPLLSKIPGIRRRAEAEGREVVVAPGGVESSLELYDSLVLERSLADAWREDPRWLTILPDRELAHVHRQWPALPTFSHGELSLGRLEPSAARTAQT